MTDLFQNTQNEQTTLNANASLLETLVGDGKKFKDPEQLAKGKLEADAFIERLKAEKKILEDEIAKRSTTEELLAKIKEEVGNRSSLDNQPSQPIIPGETIDETKVLKLAKQLIDQEKIVSQRQQNVDRVKNELQKAWGSNFQEALKAKVQTLKLTEQYAAQLAEENPDAFINIIVGTPRENVNAALPPRSSQTSVPHLGNSETENFKKTIANRDYRKPNVQLEIHRKSIAAGQSILE